MAYEVESMIVRWLAPLGLLLAAGCTRITQVPQCPAQADVGQAISITADVSNPGATPRYLWEVFPTGAGTFADSSSVSTTFTPSQSGQVTLRLSAADGLFLYVNQCVVQVGGGTNAALAVSLIADPTAANTGDEVALVCSSVGTEAATTITITQTEGNTVNLTVPFPGIARFTTNTAGTYTFECVGQGADGSNSAPATITITVTAPGRGGR